MSAYRTIRITAVLLLLGLAGCFRGGFNASRFTGHDELFAASLQQLERGRWDNAIQGFERLSLEMPARDPRLPRVHFSLATAHEGKREHLLAAQSFTRVAETFPNDTLADRSLLAAGRNYAALWRRPDLDAQYGEVAVVTLETLLGMYPNSQHRGEAEAEIARLRSWLARKTLENGRHYLRRRAFDSAVIYLRDVWQEYPETPEARLALLDMVSAYRAIRWPQEVAEVCNQLRQRYPGDSEVEASCPSAAPQQVTTPGG